MDYVWRNIKLHAGEKFHTKTGVEFSYHIRNDYIVLENTNRSIPRKQVEEALLINRYMVLEYNKLQVYAYLFGWNHDALIIGK